MLLEGSRLPEPIKDLIAQGKYPFLEDANDYFKIIREFTGSYVDLVYSTDQEVLTDPEIREFWGNILSTFEISRSGRPSTVRGLDGRSKLADFLAVYVTSVSALHLHVGTVGEYLTSPNFAGGAIRPGRNRGDVQKSMLAMVIALSTGKTQPSGGSSFPSSRPPLLLLLLFWPRCPVSSTPPNLNSPVPT